MFLAAESEGYYLLCFPYHSDKVKYLEAYTTLMENGRVDGFVFTNVEYNDARIELLQKGKNPFVAFWRSNTELIYPCIDVDGGLGISMCVEHLLDQGHKKIAALAWPEDSRVGQNRLEGYF